jgi:AraC family transcriptional regulator, carnitine catabolism transcriptional activator
MAERFPDVEVTDARVVIDGDRLTCGGVTTAFDLVLALIEAHHGPMLGSRWRRCSSRATARPQGRARAPADPPPGGRCRGGGDAAQHRDAAAGAGIAAGAGVTQRALEAAFRETFGRTPQAVYRGLRLREARRLLAGTAMSVAEVAARCGYENASAMTRAFRAEFDMRPRDLRRAASRA